MSSISHRRARELLDNAQDNDLLSVDAALLNNHLAACDDCRAYALAANEFDLALTDALQRRWQTRWLRKADEQDAQSDILKYINSYRLLRKAREFTLSLSWAAMIGVALLGFVWLLSSFTQPVSSPNIPEVTVSGGDQDRETLYLETFNRSDLNCDQTDETIFLQREVLSLNGIQTTYTSPFPLTGVIVQNSEGSRWVFNAADLGGDYISDHLLFRTSPCSSLIALKIAGGVSWFVIFRWDGERTETLLQSPGQPIALFGETHETLLLPGDQLDVQENDHVNGARCALIHVSYIWDGFAFDKFKDARRDQYCVGNQ
jgi:hypothetical protein